MFRNPRTAEWADSPKRSGYGQGMKRAAGGKLLAFPPPVLASNVRDGMRGFRDTFGHVVNRVPYPAPVTGSRFAYRGQLPLETMPLVAKPRPWISG